jgi:hypothetical protein
MAFDTEFRFVSIMTLAVFIFIFCVIVVIAVRGIAKWKKNNKSPRLSVDAKLVSKRTDVSSSGSMGSGSMGQGRGINDDFGAMTRTRYYAAFQVESGDRMEFEVPDTEFGMLAEGDTGKLSFRGTRYLGFERI